MSKTATMTIRLDPEVKSAAENIYSHYGMTLTEAVNVFFHQSINVKGLPFDLRPSPSMLEALREVNEMKAHPDAHKGYRNVSEMFDDILAEAD
jgi:DNA-damage-inducible protein J